MLPCVTSYGPVHILTGLCDDQKLINLSLYASLAWQWDKNDLVSPSVYLAFVLSIELITIGEIV